MTSASLESSETVLEAPLSAGQRALWFLHRLAPRSSVYNTLFAARLCSTVDEKALKLALVELARRHPILRTTFGRGTGDRVSQRVTMDSEVDFAAHEAVGWSASRLREEARREVARPFELEVRPAWRARLWSLSADRHLLVFVAHHILADLWTLMLLARELGELYAAATGGPPARLEPVPGYSEHVRFQEELLSGEEGERLAAFWQENLAGAPPLSSLPADRPRPAVETLAGAHLVRSRRGLAAVLGELAATVDGASGLMALLAVFYALLGRHTGQPDVVVGSPVPGRRGRPEFARIAGNFVNVLALRVDLSGRPSFRRLLARVVSVVKAARQHQEYPFPRIVEDLAPDRDPSHNPLLQTTVSLQRLRDVDGGDLGAFFVAEENDAVEIDLGGLRARPAGLGQQDGQFDLSLWVTELENAGEDEAWLEWKYRSELYDRASVERFARHFERLVEAAVAAPDLPLDELPMMSRVELHQLMREWNTPPWSAAAMAEPTVSSLPAALAHRAAASPRAPALTYGGETVDYGALKERADRLAARLGALGVGPEIRVGLVMQRSLEMVVGVLGILTAGGAYVPIDPAHPQERIDSVLDDAGLEIVVTEKLLAERFAVAGRRTVVCGSAADGSGELESADWEPPRLGPKNLAYVIYTSGSTGRPKGVEVTHGDVLHLVFRGGALWDFGPRDAWSLFHSIAFDVSVWEIWGAICSGGRLVVVPESARRSPDEFQALLEREKVSILCQTPSAFRQWQQAAALRDGPTESLAVRAVIFAGEALEPRVLAAWLPGSVCFYNLYGITETTVHSSYRRLGERDLGGPAVSPVGRPMPHVSFYLLGPDGRPVPVGATGEIYVGGASVSRGYHRQPALTAERFVPDPNGAPGSRLYRSGDLARLGHNGELLYLGRRDHQVQVRGFRIELGEVEATLAAHPAVGNAAVSAHEEDGVTSLVAHASPAAGEKLAVDDLRRFLSEKLPEYMVPTRWILLDALPLNANGKVDRAALPPPSSARPAMEVAWAAPESELEKRIAALWQEMLGVERLGLDDNFFDIGGHSLLAAEMQNQLGAELALELSLGEFFRRPTVRALAATIAAQQAESSAPAAAPGESEVVAIEPSPAAAHEPFPLTQMQQAYWIGRQDVFDLGSVSGHVYWEFESAAGEIDLERLERGWQRLIEHHGMLRAIVEPDGHQRVLPLAQVEPYRIAVDDLRAAEPAAVAAWQEEVRERLSHQVFAAESWPLFEIRAARLPGDRLRTLVSLDALVLDASSVFLLFEQWERLHRDPAADLEPLDLGFRDCVLALEARRHSPAYERARRYWQNHLEHLPPAPQLPLEPGFAAATRPRFAHRGGELDGERWERLRQRSGRAGLSPSGVLLAAYAEVLARWSKSPRFTLNLTFFNRPRLHPRIDEVVGDFTSTLLVEYESAGESFGERARALQGRLGEAMDHGAMSGIEVLRELGRRRGGEAAAMPVVFTSTLVHRRRQRSPTAWLGEQIYAISQTPQVWLDHVVRETDRLHYDWDAVEDAFFPGALDEMVMAYGGLLERLAESAHPWTASTPRSVAVPTDQLARRAAVNAAADAPADTPGDAASREPAADDETRLHHLCRRHLAKRSAALAVHGPRRSLSYGELQSAARRLGQELRRHGARPGRLVAVVMAKGWEMAVAIRGVLESGAAYLPIDPAMPRERLAHLLEQGEVEIALTQKSQRDQVAWPDDPSGSLEVLMIDEEWLAEEVAPGPEALDDPAQAADDLAYVIYTSGSTGRPKGVMIEHRAAVNTLVDVVRRFAVGPEDRVLALSSLGFDLSVFDFFGTWAAGGTVILPRAERERDPAHWLELLEAGVTVWNSVPALFSLLIDHLETRGSRPPAGLRLVLLSGDWIPLDLPARWRRLGGTARLVSLGGATEASIWSIYHEMGEVDPAWSSIPYGRPLAHQRWHVLDENLEPCPDGVTGQLYIGGAGLARGYWRDQERTRNAFLTHPASGERLYRTGDLGRYLAHGEIEILGREDHQVKIHGYRIELGEIESALREHEEVARAVVAAEGDPRGDRRLVAYVVPRAVEARAVEEEAVEASSGGSMASGGSKAFGGSAVPDDVESAAPEWPPGVIADPLERLEHKSARHFLRPMTPDAGIDLGSPSAGLDELRQRRRSWRRFRSAPVARADLGALLAALVPSRPAGAAFPKYAYGSAGGLYPVQTYLYAKPGRVEGIPAGAYYHHPDHHRLLPLSTTAWLEADHWALPNRELFEQAAFALFLVLKKSVIAPLYGEQARDYGLIEAGLICQLLEEKAPDHGLGLCQVGGFDFAPHAAGFDLDEDHLYLHALLGGALPDEAGGRRTAAPLDDRLREFLAGKLPHYMVPAAFVELEELPLTANGKVDRGALAAVERSAPEPPAPAAPAATVPSSAVEQTVAAVVREVLSIQGEVGLESNLTALGASSLQMVQIHGRLREATGRALEITEMFRHPTLGELAARLADGGETQGTTTRGGGGTAESPADPALERAARRAAARRGTGRRGRRKTGREEES